MNLSHLFIQGEVCRDESVLRDKYRFSFLIKHQAYLSHLFVPDAVTVGTVTREVVLRDKNS